MTPRPAGPLLTFDCHHPLRRLVRYPCMTQSYPATPDGRYFVVRGRLWRCSDPSLSAPEREVLVKELMAARRAVGVAQRAGDDAAQDAAHRAVDEAKHKLGERGTVWWTDGAPDYNRHMARTTPYAVWFAAL